MGESIELTFKIASDGKVEATYSEGSGQSAILNWDSIPKKLQAIIDLTKESIAAAETSENTATSPDQISKL